MSSHYHMTAHSCVDITLSHRSCASLSSVASIATAAPSCPRPRQPTTIQSKRDRFQLSDNDDDGQTELHALTPCTSPRMKKHRVEDDNVNGGTAYFSPSLDNSPETVVTSVTPLPHHQLNLFDYPTKHAVFDYDAFCGRTPNATFHYNRSFYNKNISTAIVSWEPQFIFNDCSSGSAGHHENNSATASVSPAPHHPRGLHFCDTDDAMCESGPRLAFDVGHPNGHDKTDAKNKSSYAYNECDPALYGCYIGE